MKVGIIGVTGYTGIELIRILSNHPKVELGLLAASTEGDLIEDYPHLEGVLQTTKIVGEPFTDLAGCELIFTAIPHGKGMELIPELLSKGCKVIDLGGDFRYKTRQRYEEWYHLEHTAPELLPEACYGLPELYKEEIKKARLIANPGCYPTASILSIAPLLAGQIANKNTIIIDAKSGVSGAGKSANRNVHFCEVDESFKAYNPAVHRHTSEIEEKLSIVAGDEILLSFTPHLLPVKRGILATIYVDLLKSVTPDEIYQIYQEFYQDQPFVRVRKPGHLPELKHVTTSNFCDIGFQLDKRLNRLVIVSVIDNLVKGASGQAVQNMNLMAGFEETLGLTGLPTYL